MNDPMTEIPFPGAQITNTKEVSMKRDTGFGRLVGASEQRTENLNPFAQSALESLKRHGVRVYVIEARDFYFNLGDLVERDRKNQNVFENIGSITVACDAGELRSVALGTFIQNEVSGLDFTYSKKGLINSELFSGQSQTNLNKDICEGSISEDGRVVPDGFESPVRSIVTLTSGSLTLNLQALERNIRGLSEKASNKNNAIQSLDIILVTGDLNINSTSMTNLKKRVESLAA